MRDPLLATAGFPPFGANGLAISADGKALFVANIGDDRVLKVDVATQVVSVFAERVNAADGIAFDASARLWAAANQADEVVTLNENGRVIVGDHMFVTNLALPLTDSAATSRRRR